MNELKELSERWTKEILLRCTGRELIVLIGEYGIVAIAKRMGYADIVHFLESGKLGFKE